MRLRPAALAFSVFLLTANLTCGGIAAAASLEQTFNQASQAYQKGDFATAGQLFTQAGDMLYKKDQSQAVQIYGNASVAYLQAKRYEDAVALYRKMLSSNKAKLDNQQKLKYFQNLVFSLGQLEQYALQASEIDKIVGVDQGKGKGKSKNKGKAKGQNAQTLNIKLSADEKSLLLATQGDAYRHHELYELAVSSYQRSLDNLPKNADSERRTTLLTALGLCEGNLGLYDSALKHLQAAHDVAQKGNVEQSIVESLSNIGIINWEQGNYAEALKQLSAAIDRENKASLQRHIGVDSNNMGLVYRAMGNYKQAMTLVQNSLDIAREVQNERDEGIATVNRALLFRIAGQYEDAIRDYNHALAIFNKIDYREGIAGAKLGIGKMIALKDHDYKQTLQNYEEALKIYQDLKLVRSESETLIQLAALYKDMLEQALKTIPDSQQLLQDAKDQQPAVQTTSTTKTNSNATTQDANAGNLFQQFKGGNRDLVFEDDEPNTARTSSTSGQSTPTLAQNNAATPENKKPEFGFYYVDESEEDEQLTSPHLNAEQQNWLKLCREFSTKALTNAEKLRAKEFIWSGHQLLGYCDYITGNYPQAYDHYKSAIDLVTNIYTSVSDVENFGEYIADKEDLYTEGQAVCHAMYVTTKDQKYLSQMLQYADTLQNEIQKAASSLVDLHFIDPEKQKLFEKLSRLGKQLQAAEKAVTIAPTVDEKTATPDQLAQQEQSKKAYELTVKRVDDLNRDFTQLKEEWCQKYPQDRIIFESSSRVDTAKLQNYLKDDQVALSYTQLQDMMIITAISKDKIESFKVDVNRDDLDSLIRKDFLINYIEGNEDKDGNKDGFGRSWSDYNTKQFVQSYDQVTDVLAKLYQYLITPAEKSLTDKKRIYVIASGLISQLPFGALVKGKSGDLSKHGGNVDYLIKHHDIGYLRPAFIDSALQSKRDTDTSKVKRLFAVANPFNPNFQMKQLEGTLKEIAKANKLLGENSQPNDIGLEARLEKTSAKDAKNKVESLFKEYAQKITSPSEKWLRQQLQDNKYEIVYFSTHGMPYSNVIATVNMFEDDLKEQQIDFDQYATAYHNAKTDEERQKVLEERPYLKKKLRWFRLKQTRLHNLLSNSPLNGFLYLSTDTNKNSLIADVPQVEDGLLTVKEVLELPNENFSATKYVLLSACNTGVTYVTAAMADDLDINGTFSSEESDKELKKLGLIPGVDQVSFVDTFMRKGVDNVYGTLWFVDDDMSSELLTRFMTNLNQKEQYPDAVSAFNQAQRSIILDSEAGTTVVADYYEIPAHPFFWAPGAMFGK